MGAQGDAVAPVSQAPRAHPSSESGLGQEAVAAGAKGLWRLWAKM